MHNKFISARLSILMISYHNKLLFIYANNMIDYVIVISLPGGVVVLHISVGRSLTPMCKTTPQGGI